MGFVYRGYVAALTTHPDGTITGRVEGHDQLDFEGFSVASAEREFRDHVDAWIEHLTVNREEPARAGDVLEMPAEPGGQAWEDAERFGAMFRGTGV